MKTCLKSKEKIIKVAELELVPKGAVEWGGFGGLRRLFSETYGLTRLSIQIMLNRVCTSPALFCVGISKENKDNYCKTQCLFKVLDLEDESHNW